MKTSEASDLRPASWTWLKGWKARLFGRSEVQDNAGAAGGADFPCPDAPGSAATAKLTPEERRLLLDLARRSVEAAVKDEILPEIDPPPGSKRLLQPSGCFVTLRNKGKLRGCLGQIFPRAALYRAVMHNARCAATGDPRFAHVQPDELQQIEIEISILAEPQPLRFDSPEELLTKLNPQADGVVLQIGERTATFLPQVWANIPDRVAFMDSLARKADCDEDAWRKPGASVSVYRAESFKDSG
ncbi:MAG: AmmeMemoRadiSam system protein A [Verrucomicrobia bacterium]|nr:AmmeMemoRadiSam system protein A [Verrucomicrobiota bacterium]